MPILMNAKKALRVSKQKAAMNQPVRSRLKTAFDLSKKTATPESLSSAFSAIDKAVKRNVIHRKKAARMKSQLAKATTKVVAKPLAKAVKAKATKKTAK